MRDIILYRHGFIDLPKLVISVRFETFACGDMTSSSVSFKYSSKSSSSDERNSSSPAPSSPTLSTTTTGLAANSPSPHHHDVRFTPHRVASFIDARHRASTTAAREYVCECSCTRIQTRANSSTPKPRSRPLVRARGVSLSFSCLFHAIRARGVAPL